MELILIVAGFVLLDFLALRFGVDSRVLDENARRDWWPASPGSPSQHAPQDLVDAYRAERLREAATDHLVGQALTGRPTIRVRLARLLNELADRLEPPAPARPARPTSLTGPRQSLACWGSTSAFPTAATRRQSRRVISVPCEQAYDGCTAPRARWGRLTGG